MPCSSPSSGAPSTEVHQDASDLEAVWLPKNRVAARRIVDVYFSKLSPHRPVLLRATFENGLNALYDGAAAYDPGFLCSVYLVFALGTLYNLRRHEAVAQEAGAPDWPSHDEFVEHAFAVKSKLCGTISSLQALILLRWYIYPEVCPFTTSMLSTLSNGTFLNTA